jgi:glycosyltransferase involved in cell wall biosynthesis
MKVGLLTQWFDPEPGPAAIPGTLGRELLARGHRVRVLTGFPNYPTGKVSEGYRVTRRTDMIDGGLSTRRVGLYPSHDGATLGRVLNYASFAVSASLSGTSWMRGADGLWIYNSPPTIGLPTWLIKSRYRPRVVLHIMDMWPESLEASGFGRVLEERPWVAQRLDAWLSSTYDVADAIACTSRRQVSLLIERGVPAEKLSLVPVWQDESIFHPAAPEAELVSSLGVKDRWVLLYAGSLGNAQGLDTLLEACALLRHRVEFHCLIAGSGVAEERLRGTARTLGLKNVTFLGRWPSEDMTRLMAVGDVHLVSLGASPLAGIAMPSKLQAILASGRPLIVAANGEAADIAEASGAGWVCPPGDAAALAQTVAEAMDTPERARDDLGRSGLEYYKREFSVRSGVNKIERLLEAANLGDH